MALRLGARAFCVAQPALRRSTGTTKVRAVPVRQERSARSELIQV
jgi:hypothetical protein